MPWEGVPAVENKQNSPGLSAGAEIKPGRQAGDARNAPGNFRNQFK